MKLTFLLRYSHCYCHFMLSFYSISYYHHTYLPCYILYLHHKIPRPARAFFEVFVYSTCMGDENIWPALLGRQYPEKSLLHKDGKEPLKYIAQKICSPGSQRKKNYTKGNKKKKSCPYLNTSRIFLLQIRIVPATPGRSFSGFSSVLNSFPSHKTTSSLLQNRLQTKKPSKKNQYVLRTSEMGF